MLEKIAIFIIFLGPLVFFHELGHFLFARFFGVRVEVFSIGFGPKILKWKKGDTQYAFSLIPLGGYVKMFGDNPFSDKELTEEEKKYSFIHKGKWARFWIVFGGPLANFILAFVLFFSLFVYGEKVLEMRVGRVEEKSSFYKMGIRSGDLIEKANGVQVYTPTDLVLDGAGKMETITVKRLGASKKLKVSIEGSKFFEKFANHSPAGLRRPLVVNKKGNFFALSIEETHFDLTVPLSTIQEFAGRKFYAFPLKEVDNELVKEDGKPLVITFVKGESFNLALGRAGFRAAEMYIEKMNIGSPAEKSGLKSSDVIISLDGKNIYDFDILRSTLQQIKSDQVKVAAWRNGKIIEYDLKPDIREIRGEKIKLIGVYRYDSFFKKRFIRTPALGIIEAGSRSAIRTWGTIGETLSGFKKLITAEVSFKSVGGPIAIGRVASDSFKISLSYFFQLMALFSVNLGIINLFPIPILDGGHIFFIGIEIVNGGPLSRKKMEIAQQTGLAILLLLMFGALFNDFSTFFS